jgi:hypothetical protein
MDHGTFRRLAAGAVLDDLDPAERLTFETHRTVCASCRRLFDELGGVVLDLALVADPRRPPVGLRDAVLDAVKAAGPGPRAITASRRPDAARPTSPTPIRLRRGTRPASWIGIAGLAAAAVLAIASGGLVVRSIQLADEVAVARAAVADARAESAEARAALAAMRGTRTTETATMSAALAVAIDPQHRTASLHPEAMAPVATGLVVYRPGSTDAYLLATDLPATPSGHVYQLWVADDTGVHGLGTFHYDGIGAFVAPIGRDLGGAAAAMVTLESDGGATGEPGPQVIFGEL